MSSTAISDMDNAPLGVSFTGSGTLNKPVTTSATIVVLTLEGGYNVKVQMFFYMSTLYIRRGGSTWDAWRKVSLETA